MIVGPGSGELGDRLTHREASELDEGVVHAERTTSHLSAASSGGVVAVISGGSATAVATAGPTERRIEERADHAVFRRGTGVNVEVFTSPHGVIVAEGVVRARDAGIVAGVDAVGVQRDLSAQITTQLDAGVGAGDVVETRAVERTNLHVFDRLGLHGKIGCLRSAHGDQTRRRAEQKALYQLHVKPPSLKPRTIPCTKPFELPAKRRWKSTHPRSLGLIKRIT